jgi:hypothetical protein
VSFIPLCICISWSFWKIPQWKWCTSPFFGNIRLFNACLYLRHLCSSFSFKHLSFSIDRECLQGRAISYLTLVVPIPSSIMLKEWVGDEGSRFLSFHSPLILQDLIKVQISLCSREVLNLLGGSRWHDKWHLTRKILMGVIPLQPFSEALKNENFHSSFPPHPKKVRLPRNTPPNTGCLITVILKPS